MQDQREGSGERQSQLLQSLEISAITRRELVTGFDCAGRDHAIHQRAAAAATGVEEGRGELRFRRAERERFSDEPCDANDDDVGNRTASELGPGRSRDADRFAATEPSAKQV